MFKIIKAERQHFPALRLIGRRYTNADRGSDGSFSNRLVEWHDDGLWARLDKLAAYPEFANGPAGDSLEVDRLLGCSQVEGSREVDRLLGCSPVGLMTINSKNHTDFAYWIGRFLPPNTTAPEGFDYLDLPESDVGMTWVYGSDKNGEIYGGEPHNASYNALNEVGMGALNENAGGKETLVFFEWYVNGRIDAPDEHGNVILDYGFYIA